MLDPGVAIATSALMSFVLLGLLGSLLRAGKAGIAEWFGANLAVVVALPMACRLSWPMSCWPWVGLRTTQAARVFSAAGRSGPSCWQV
jgi:hypothetical protein